MRYPFLDLKTVNEPWMDALREAACRVVDSGRYVGGEEIDAFEKDLAQLSHTDYAVATSNGLDALRLIFRALVRLGRLRPGDGVIVPANTYIASALAISDAGLEPVFVDIDPATLNMDTSMLGKHIGPDIRAVLTVHLYGRPCFDECLKEVATRHNLIVVEDNAQAIGAEAATEGFNGTRITGGLGHAAAFSFYPTKNIGALGDAGAVTTSDRELADAVRSLANYGADRRYHNIYKGFNCRMDPIQAAFLRVKLPFTESENKRRRRLAATYDDAISHPGIIKPLVGDPDLSVWHQYVIRSPRRDELQTYLTENGVGTDVNYPLPCHLQPCYSEYAGISLPVSEKVAGELLCLPVSACTSERDAREIAAIINGFGK